MQVIKRDLRRGEGSTVGYSADKTSSGGLRWSPVLMCMCTSTVPGASPKQMNKRSKAKLSKLPPNFVTIFVVDRTNEVMRAILNDVLIKGFESNESLILTFKPLSPLRPASLTDCRQSANKSISGSALTAESTVESVSHLASYRATSRDKPYKWPWHPK